MRIFCFLVLIFSIIFFSLPVTIGLFVISVSIFSKFWEGILAGVFLDSLYLSPNLFSTVKIGFLTISFILVFLALEKFKSVIQGKNFVSKLMIIFVGGFSFYFLLFFFGF